MKTKKPRTVKQLASMGGNARARKLTKKRQSEIGRNAANARWKKRKPRRKTNKKNENAMAKVERGNSNIPMVENTVSESGGAPS